MPATGPCDALDGPLVALARRALETEDVNHVLPWVRAEDEEEIRRALRHALALRKFWPDARELAETHFFETLVRAHRASEGAPYTGLKPAGADVGPALPAAGRALDSGYVRGLVTLLIDAVRSGVHRHFEAAMKRSNFPVEDVAAGRAYVEAYESYVRYVERLWEAATQPHAHAPGAPEGGADGPAPRAH